MQVRAPAVAGQFYPASAEQCLAEVQSCLSTTPPAEQSAETPVSGVIGGIVPHAGWVFSGAVAGQVIQALAADNSIETVVVFGAAHRLSGPLASVWASGSWQSPLGETPIDEALASAVIQASSAVVKDSTAHKIEHSIEVQLPFMQHLMPSVKLLPIMVPPVESAAEIGRAVAEQVQKLGTRAVFLGSSDLTHYGPRYRFTPKGSGPEGLVWAKEVNDRRMLDLVIAMQAEKVVAEAVTQHNACGSGAIAAAIAASRVCGASKAQVLEHTTSSEVLPDRYGQAADAVGYAGVIFIRQA